MLITSKAMYQMIINNKNINLLLQTKLMYKYINKNATI